MLRLARMRCRTFTSAQVRGRLETARVDGTATDALKGSMAKSRTNVLATLHTRSSLQFKHIPWTDVEFSSAGMCAGSTSAPDAKQQAALEKSYDACLGKCAEKVSLLNNTNMYFPLPYLLSKEELRR